MERIIRNNKSYGITLIALVITIIVLLILAGISISMLSGNNSILSRVGEAKEKTEESQIEELAKSVVMGSYDGTGKLDLNKLLTNFEGEEDITVRATENEVTKTFPVTVSKGDKTYKITSDGQINEVKEEDRTGISVGDYIEYIPPKSYVEIEGNWTGYTNIDKFTINAKKIFRVFEINPDGSLILIGAMTKDDDKLKFKGAKGYNNIVYILNSKCSEMYKDTSKGITARSINGDDIRKYLSQAGKDSFSSYIDSIITGLVEDENITRGRKADGVTFDNTVTYSNINTNYPDLFKYEASGKINNIATQGIVDPDKSYNGYNGLTNLGNVLPNPTSITVTQTYVNKTISKTFFTDENYFNMLFKTDGGFFVATRSWGCYNGDKCCSFMIEKVSGGWFTSNDLYESKNTSVGNEGSICPIVTIPPDTKVIISENPKNQNNPNGTVHKVQ